ncbi:MULTISPECIES: polyphosphate kinase 2 [Dermacoccus]|uniref:polyphosphate kinase 2 n=1 Tax=Dermacoccus TaxID=57495 RepID=UPI0007836A74|nr:MULTISPECIES: polyphosphate kinase 2 [Dermacoccus]MCT1604654.1 polyphosphate kinase 2 [Dermacoccus nishinomiyaensis]QQY25023.1 polyphosphate kinase 2 [Dermacoccus nishinomiyaensis]TCJ90478.1 polyphosphate kinase 2 [Dermacoccus sp. SAI-028]STD17915.1 polyphosphate kinase 2 [Dermacoccus nishinomiyaensis]
MGKKKFKTQDETWQHNYPYDVKMTRTEYEYLKRQMQIELLKMQAWVKESGEKVVLIFEGRDAAGKGGSIKRFNEHLNPRGARTVALDKPSEREMGQWYFQRYVSHLPTAGEIVFFDRSWYNRAGVERVMGYCTDEQYDEFMRTAPQFEQMLTGSGIHLRKLWFSVGKAEQLTRFEKRRTDPLRQWKLSPTDLASLDKWDDYTKAKEAMFEHTDTEWAPWTVIKSNDKKRARVEVMRYVLDSLDYPGKNTDFIHAPDPLIVGPAKHILDEGEGGFQEGYPDRHDGGKTPTHTAPKSKSAAKARAKAQAEVKALEMQRAAESIARGDGDKSAEQKSAEAKAAEGR